MSEYHRLRQQKIRTDLDDTSRAMKGCIGGTVLLALFYYVAIIGLIVAGIWFLVVKA